MQFFPCLQKQYFQLQLEKVKSAGYVYFHAYLENLSLPHYLPLVLGGLLGRSVLIKETNRCLSEIVIFAHFAKFLKAAAAVFAVDATDLYIAFACFKGCSESIANEVSMCMDRK